MVWSASTGILPFSWLKLDEVLDVSCFLAAMGVWCASYANACLEPDGSGFALPLRIVIRC